MGINKHFYDSAYKKSGGLDGLSVLKRTKKRTDKNTKDSPHSQHDRDKSQG